MHFQRESTTWAFTERKGAPLSLTPEVLGKGEMLSEVDVPARTRKEIKPRSPAWQHTVMLPALENLTTGGSQRRSELLSLWPLREPVKMSRWITTEGDT